MYLYEAIKLGAMSKPQGRGHLSSNPKNEVLCAVGAAKFACNLKFFGMIGMSKAFPVCLSREINNIPQLPFPVTDVLSVIWQLNDHAKWTREQIADWLMPIELAFYEQHPKLRPKDVEIEAAQKELVYV